MKTWNIIRNSNSELEVVSSDLPIPAGCALEVETANPDYLVELQNSATNLREELKRARAETVARIKVTTQAGNTFDGDEESQTRMARAILALQATGTPSVNWVLADNTPIAASAAELAEALALAGAAQAAVWVI